MRFIACALLFLSFLVTPLLAQVPPAPAEQSTGLDDLIRILENDETRGELIERLRASDTAETPPTAAAEPAIARQIAEYTRDVAESVSTTMGMMVELAGDVGNALSAGNGADLSAFMRVAGNILVLAVVLVASYVFIRSLARRAQVAISHRVENRGWFSRLLGLVGATLADLGAVAGAWAIGYAVSLYFLAEPGGRMGINQTLLLNAFLVVELTKVALRALFEPHGAAMRPLPMSDTSAAYWYFWFARIVGLIGYSFMFFAPILADNVSALASSALRVLAMFAAGLIAVLIILQNKQPVREAMVWRARNGRHDVLSRTLAFLGAYWHMIAIAYVVAVFVVWLANPQEALPYMLRATLQSALAVAIGIMVITFVSRVVHVGVRLPDDLKQRLPLLESRLHAFVPRVMQVVRTVALIGVAIAIAQAWGMIDFVSWVASETGQRVAGSLVSALVILVVGFALYLAVSSWVEFRLNPNVGTVPTAREKTLLALFHNAFTIALAIFVAMLALAQIGINIAPLLAGAGVLGLAIGFGAQKFVQDIITGIFIQLENVMNEGDVVTAGGQTGVVEKLTIRSVSIRSLDGTLHLVPFSSVDAVSNWMKGFSFHVADIKVTYSADIDEVKKAMNEAFDMLMETESRTSIIGDLEMFGVNEFGVYEIIVRGRIKTLPGMQWAVGRAYNECIKTVFARRGIEIPVQQMKLHMTEDARGRPALPAPPAPTPPAEGGETAG